MLPARPSRPDPLTVVGALLGTAALIWLAPLMLDQFVLFADQEQSRQAAESRAVMAAPGGLLLVAVAVMLARGRTWHALFAALPALVAIPLAWLTPDALYQLLAYVITAPLAVGAMLAAAAPLPDRLPVAAIAAGVALLAGLVFLATPFIALMAFLALFAWWRMPPEGPPSLVRPGWR